MVEIGNHLKTRVVSEELKEEMINIGSDCVHFSRLPPACRWWTLHRCWDCSGRTQPARKAGYEREGKTSRSLQERTREWATAAAAITETHDSECDEGSEFCMAAFKDFIATNLGTFFGKLGVLKLKQKSAALPNP